MAIAAGDINTYLSGGASNSDPDASLGGAKSSTEWTGGTLHDLFDAVSGDENQFLALLRAPGGELLPISIDSTPQPQRPPRRRSRRATPQDIERIDEMKLEDFDVDLSGVELPQKPEGERLTTQELDSAVESFLSALQER